MVRILVINSKGGCGKSTIATNLASYYAGQGEVVALQDHDAQGSSLRWNRLRPANVPGVFSANVHQHRGESVTHSWAMRLPPDTQKVIVDTPAGVTVSQLLELLRDVDVMLIPVLPSAIDVHAVAHFIESLLIKGKVRQRGIPVGVVANRVKERTLAYQSLERFLGTLNLPFVARLRETQNYVHAVGLGLGVHDLPASRAQKDVEQWQPLVDWLDEHTPAPHGIPPVGPRGLATNRVGCS